VAVETLRGLDICQSPSAQLAVIERTVQKVVTCASNLSKPQSEHNSAITVYVFTLLFVTDILICEQYCVCYIEHYGFAILILVLCLVFLSIIYCWSYCDVSRCLCDISGADDLLPLFIYIFVRSQISHPTAAVACMSDWAEARRIAMGQLDYCLTTFQLAVSFIEDVSVDELLENRAVNRQWTQRFSVNPMSPLPLTSPSKNKRGVATIWKKFKLPPSESLIGGMSDWKK